MSSSSEVALARNGERWDSVCLVTPDWFVRLQAIVDGSDPDGFMVRDGIVSYIERYARACGAPIRETSRSRRSKGAAAHQPS